MDDKPIRLDDPTTWPPSAREYYDRWRRDHYGRPELERLIRDRIRTRGAITFAEFMALALYHPDYGYYRTGVGRMARGGDYLTSPETHPAFGFLLGRWLWSTWHGMGRPSEWTVLEAGAGTGRLAHQILSSASSFEPVFAAALHYGIVEPDPAARAVQYRTVAEHAERVSWVESMDSVAERPIVGCVLTNELLDALPVHRVVRRGRALRELWVVERGGALAEEPRSLSRPELRAYFRPYGFLPPADRPVEVNLSAPEWIAGAARALQRGFLLTLDYGAHAPELYRGRSAGSTLRAYHRHVVSNDPFARIGEQDLTADVDFSALTRAGLAAGLTLREDTTQREFLSRLAWEEWKQGRPFRFPGPPRRSRALRELVDPANLGEIRVLVQEKTG